MRVDLFACSALIEAHKAVQQVITSRIIVIAAISRNIRRLKGLERNKNACLPSVIWEVVAHGGMRQLLREQIDFVEEQNDARFDEPSRVANGIK